MPVYTDVVASRLQKYRAQLEKTNGQNDADIDFAILKYVICQLVDASFSGGGGGGSTSAATIAAGIDLSTDISSVMASLLSLDTKALAQSDITAAIQAATDIDTLITRLTSIDSKLQSGYRSAATITRAANTTAYTANDVWGGAFELVNFGSSGGLVILTDVRVTFNIPTLPSGMAGFALYLYSVTPPSAVADNGAFSYPSADRGTAINPIALTPNGIDLGSAQSALGGGSVVATASNIDQTFKLASGSTSVFGYLVSRGAYTPAASGETATLETLAVGV